MALLQWANPRSRRVVAKVSGISIIASAVVAGALIYPGFASAELDLNDGSVWVTNRSAGLVGHLNDQSKVLDGGFTSAVTGFDVLQNANTVFQSDAAGTLLNPVNTPLMAVDSETALGGGKSTSLGSSVVAITDAGQGKVWAMPAANVSSFLDKTSPTLLKSLENPVSVVAPNDTIFTANQKTGEITKSTIDSAGKVVTQSTEVVEGLAGIKDISLTVVGSKVVAFSATTGQLFLPGGKKVTVADSRGALLSQPVEAGNFVAIETVKGLIRQPLDGSSATQQELPASGTAVAPIIQGDCIHAAWGGSNQYLHSCNGQGQPIDIKSANGQSQFVFRKNRDVVVLNDVNSGKVWLVNQSMMLVNNWDDLKADQKKADNADEDSADPNVVNTLPDRTKPNRAPLTVADSFGVRAGNTTILPVLFNDSDPDGDVLTSTAPEEVAGLGSIQAIYGGTGLQVTVPRDATGTHAFQYTASDGRGGRTPGSVTVRIVPSTENTPPKSQRDSTMVLEQGQTLKQNILTDWIDPDGDDLFLTGAVSDDKSAVIKTTPDGELSYTDDGQTPGLKTMTVTVSDGKDATSHKVKVNVKPAGNVPPVVNADFVHAVVGQPVVISPLKNDQDPAGGTLRLASVAKPEFGSKSAIADNGTFSYTSNKSGTVYLEYQVTNGPKSATGLIRIDVQDKGASGAPVAVKDLAMLPAGGSTLVDVLANDLDPAGGVLVVQSIALPDGSPISATIVDRHIIRLTDLGAPGTPLRMSYTVSNGSASSQGEISVITIPAPIKAQPPRAVPDTATVRGGDIVSIPVLSNDIDPNGETLKHPIVVEAPPAADGKLFVDQDQLRFIAGPTPKTVTGVYKVGNSTKQESSTEVTITIVAADPEHNLPPAPSNVTARVVAGESTKVAIPLNGIDPEGDSVELVGLDTAPKLGTAEIGNGFISYTAAGTSAGTDSFKYRVRDRLGAEAIARIDVGIAPPAAINQPPVTSDDYISIRPGRKVLVDVLANDSDPDGGALALVKDGFKGPQGMDPTITPKGKVIVTSPEDIGTATMMYTVADKYKSTATGNIRMTVTPDAVLRAPIARDDRVSALQALGKNTVDVPVLENDEDPDGVAEELKVKLARIDGLPQADATVSSAGVVRVVLSQNEQMIPYTVTDVDGLSATAVIWVPGLDKQYPVLAKTDVLHVTAGQSVEMMLKEYVKVRAGHTPRLTDASRVSLLGAANSNVMIGDAAGIKYAANLDFYGPGSMTFEVTDGKTADDPDGLKSTLTVMTEVAPAPKSQAKKQNAAPTFRGTTVEVPQVETVKTDLAPLASDPDPEDAGKLRFALAGQIPSGFQAELAGSVLTVTQAKNARVGGTGTVQVSVTDGRSTPAIADVVLRATASSKPLPVANDDVVADAHAGKAETVQVLANDVNPFPDTPLRVVGASVETGGTGVSVANTASTVTVNSSPEFKGTVVVKYVIEDKTKDSSRTATGRVRLTIKGHPDTPDKPQIVEEKDQAVLLTWATPSDNGSPITDYTVAWNGGSQKCPTTTCTITGLKNNTGYKFTVMATNAVGASQPSPQSVTATPDRVPDAPAAPSTKFGDGKVNISWVTPVGEYSAVKHYTVQISPPANGISERPDVKGNTIEWSGLKNGTAYTFSVRAYNNAPKPSAWSSLSAPVVPAGLPALVGAPQVGAPKASGTQSNVLVSWQAPDNNGDAISGYDLEVSGGSTGTRVIHTVDTSVPVTVENSTQQYQFKVRSTNKAGTSAYGAVSASLRAVGKLGTVAKPAISILNQNGAGGTVKVTFVPLSGEKALNGYAANEVVYCISLSSGGQQCNVSSGNTFAASNGTPVYANVWAQASAGGQSSVGDRSESSATVKPYGIPAAPSVNGSTATQGQDKWSWTWNNPGNNGSPITKFQISLDGGGWSNVGTDNSYSRAGGGFGSSATLAVRACNAGGCGSAGQDTAKAGPQSSWDTDLNTNRNCTEPAGSITYQGPIAGQGGDSAKCGGANFRSKGATWAYSGEKIVVKCYINKADDNGIVSPWYRIEAGSAYNVGRYVRSGATLLDARSAGVPVCG